MHPAFSLGCELEARSWRLRVLGIRLLHRFRLLQSGTGALDALLLFGAQVREHEPVAESGAGGEFRGHFHEDLGIRQSELQDRNVALFKVGWNEYADAVLIKVPQAA